MIKSREEAYIFGLWCADGYHRSSSIGLSNTNPKLIDRFGAYLRKNFSEDRLRLRCYVPKDARVDKQLVSKYSKISFRGVKKARHTSYHVYVNCRSLLRRFKELKERRAAMQKDFIIPYLAGRFDGDGSISSNMKKDFRIVYGNYEEADFDKRLLEQIRPCKIRIYHYKKARTYCVYISQKDAPIIVKDLMPYSSNLQKVAIHTP